MIRRRLSLLAAFTFTLALGSCAEGPVEPAAPEIEPAAGLLSGLTSILRPVEVLKRTERLDAEVVSQVVGPGGGVLTLERSGLRFEIPRGALSSPTRITITSPAGDLVGYHFEPSGLRFERSARMVQDLDGTRAGGSGLLARLLRMRLVGAYFEGPLLPRLNALELLKLDLIGGNDEAVVDIRHFSGYVIATN